MCIKKFIIFIHLLLTASASYNAAADNISVSAAQATANSFIKSHFKTAPGTLRAPAMADIVLAHTEFSAKDPQASVYYIFNIKGGGYIIVSGDDQAAPVLGYSNKGQIDANNQPEPLAALLDGYKEEIEYVKTHKIDKTKSFNNRFLDANDGVVEPMLKTTWGPEEPYNYQCPTLNGQYSRVGCVAVCMAQFINFWQFPVEVSGLPAYYSSYLGDTVPALPATTFDFAKMIPSYCHWDFEHKKVILDAFTDEQAQEVAKLCRYCGQSVKMNYNPSISTTTKSRLTEFKKFGYNSKAKNCYRVDYEDSVWIEMIRAELNEGRPVTYLAYGSNSVGHAFIIDGCDTENYFHINMGWYGHADGWYLITAIIFTGRFGEDRNYCNKHSMIVDLEPPLFCTIDAEVGAGNGLHLLGETLTALASDVKLSMSYRTLPFMFSLTDADGEQVALSESITLNRLTFENGSDINLALTLPETLPEGVYDLHLNYLTGDNDPLTQAVTSDGQLYVLGKFAKFGAPFGIADVVEAIDMILQEEPQVNIADVTMLIDYLLAN